MENRVDTIDTQSRSVTHGSLGKYNLCIPEGEKSLVIANFDMDI